jgi:hypothetical protein
MISYSYADMPSEEGVSILAQGVPCSRLDAVADML